MRFEQDRADGENPANPSSLANGVVDRTVGLEKFAERFPVNSVRGEVRSTELLENDVSAASAYLIELFADSSSRVLDVALPRPRARSVGIGKIFNHLRLLATKP